MKSTLTQDDIAALSETQQQAILEACFLAIAIDRMIDPEEQARFYEMVDAVPWTVDREHIERTLLAARQRVANTSARDDYLAWIRTIAERLPGEELRIKVVRLMTELALVGDFDREERGLLNAFLMEFRLPAEAVEHLRAEFKIDSAIHKARELLAAAVSAAGQPATRVAALARAAATAMGPGELHAALVEVQDACDQGGEDLGALHLLRSRIYEALGRPTDALAALAAAGEHGACSREVGLATARALDALGHAGEAIAAWESIASADASEVDALFEMGLAHYRTKAFEPALAAWTRAFERAPKDFWLAVRIIQAQYGVGRFEDAAATRREILGIWRGTTDPVVRRCDEYVFDRFDIPGGRVTATETLLPRDPRSFSLFVFTLEHARRCPISVRIETGDYVAHQGVPYIMAVTGADGYRIVGATDRLPYPELKQVVTRLLSNELTRLGAASRPAATTPA